MKTRNSLKSWRSLWTAGSALSTEIFTQALMRLTGGENQSTDNSAGRFQTGLELGLIPCRVRAGASRPETHRQLRR